MIDITVGKVRNSFSCSEEDFAVDDKSDSSLVDGKQRSKRLVTPGEIITREAGYMRGHGTHVSHLQTDDTLVGGDHDRRTLASSVAGFVERVDRLLCVMPVKPAYGGAVGDVVVGRIISVGDRRWKVDIQSRLNASLPLSSVNLPGGELRRRSSQDALAMRNYLVEGDLISAEVQKIQSEGLIVLHTRSLKYGKLGQGTLVRIPSALVRRRKTHFHRLPSCGGVQVIMGNNGLIWIQADSTGTADDTLNTSASAQEHTSQSDSSSVLDSSLSSRSLITSGVGDGGAGGGYVQDTTCVPDTAREAIARTRNCVVALAEQNVPLWDTSLVYAYEASLSHGAAQQLLKEDVSAAVAMTVRHRLASIANFV